MGIIIIVTRNGKTFISVSCDYDNTEKHGVNI